MVRDSPPTAPPPQSHLEQQQHPQILSPTETVISTPLPPPEQKTGTSVSIRLGLRHRRPASTTILSILIEGNFYPHLFATDPTFEDLSNQLLAKGTPLRLSAPSSRNNPTNHKVIPADTVPSDFALFIEIASVCTHSCILNNQRPSSVFCSAGGGLWPNYEILQLPLSLKTDRVGELQQFRLSQSPPSVGFREPIRPPRDRNDLPA
jgi:hypothetical protein